MYVIIYIFVMCDTFCTIVVPNTETAPLLQCDYGMETLL